MKIYTQNEIKETAQNIVNNDIIAIVNKCKGYGFDVAKVTCYKYNSEVLEQVINILSQLGFECVLNEWQVLTLRW